MRCLLNQMNSPLHRVGKIKSAVRNSQTSRFVSVPGQNTSPAPEKPRKYLHTPFRRRRSIFTHFSGAREVFIYIYLGPEKPKKHLYTPVNDCLFLIKHASVYRLSITLQQARPKPLGLNITP